MCVLVVDDNPGDRAALALLLTLDGHGVETAASPSEAIARIRKGGVSVVLLDLNYRPRATDGAEGREAFHQIRAEDRAARVVLLTAWSSVEAAVELIREGADDYVEKPWDDARLLASVRRLVAGRGHTIADADLCGLVMASPAMHQAAELALRVAPSNAPVLVTGPSGSGKERIADLIHANSSRRAGPYVRVNMGALPPELVEAELFGVERGAFTGATRRQGRFEVADGGTLLLDEIGELSARGQAALLRVLQSGEIDRLGDSRTRKVDVRLICATNRDLRACVRAGTFREDLLYRIAVIEVRVPPLRQRPEDVRVLAEHFLRVHGPARLSPGAERALVAHGWPGNVRELESCIVRGTLVARGGEVTADDLGLTAEPIAPPPAGADDEAVRVRAALEQSDGVLADAARALGITRQALYRKMRRWSIAVERRIRTDR